MDAPKQDFPDVIEKFITAVEETKELLKSPSVPGRHNRPLSEKTRRKVGVCELSPLSRRLAESDPGCLNEVTTKLLKEKAMDESDGVLGCEAHQEQHAQGLVCEMDFLLSQISNAASCLKTIYLRRSSSDYDIRDLPH